MNVRCPNCKAVFPASASVAAGEAVECPLCLMRFQTGGEETISLPQAPGPGAAKPVDDEFESFGAPVRYAQTSVFGSNARQPAPPQAAPAKSVEPTQTASHRPPSGTGAG